MPEQKLALHANLSHVERAQRSHREMHAVVMTFKEHWDGCGDFPSARLYIADPDLQAFFAGLKIGEEFEMVLRRVEDKIEP